MPITHRRRGRTSRGLQPICINVHSLDVHTQYIVLTSLYDISVVVKQNDSQMLSIRAAHLFRRADDTLRAFAQSDRISLRLEGAKQNRNGSSCRRLNQTCTWPAGTSRASVVRLMRTNYSSIVVEFLQ